MMLCICSLLGVVTAANSLLVRYFPVGGWLGWAFAASVSEASFISGLLTSLAWLALLVGLINFSNRDWYEDVLKTAELTQSVAAAQREGNLEVAPDKVRIGRTGFDKGWGADTFYFKHKIENRRGGVFLLSRSSLIFAVIIIIMALFMREGGIVAVFSFATQKRDDRGTGKANGKGLTREGSGAIGGHFLWCTKGTIASPEDSWVLISSPLSNYIA